MLKYNEYITEAKKEEKSHPFILAAKRGSSAKINSFIKSGIDINMQDSEKRTALMLASLEGFLIVVDSLINAGADVNLTDKQNRTALMMAKTKSIINKILSVDGVDVNIQDDKGNTVMMEQLTYEYTHRILIGLLEKFLEKGLNLDIKNKDGKNFYDMLKDKKDNMRGNIEVRLAELNELEKYMDKNFPQYKKEWDLKDNFRKFNV